MPFVPAPQIVMVEVRATFAGQEIENRFHVDALTAVTPTVVDDITNLVNVWTEATYFDILPRAISLRETVGTDLTTATGYQHTIVPAGPFIGGLDADAMPNEVTFCVSLRSSSRGRSARGRAYVLGLAKGDVEDNNLDPGRAASYVDAFQTLIDTLDTNGYAMCVVSYIADGDPRPGGPVYFPFVTATFTDLVVDSMRSRRPGVGS